MRFASWLSIVVVTVLLSPLGATAGAAPTAPPPKAKLSPADAVSHALIAKELKQRGLIKHDHELRGLKVTRTPEEPTVWEWTRHSITFEAATPSGTVRGTALEAEYNPNVIAAIRGLDVLSRTRIDDLVLNPAPATPPAK
jgi:hypothetical protein